jgi:hypothetical protein
MSDQMDFDLHGQTPASEVIEPIPPKRSLGPVVALGLLVVGAGLAIYVVFGRKASGPVDNVAATPPVAQATEEAIKPLGGDAERITVPPLDESDPVVRELVGRISSHPRVAAWLTTPGLVRNFSAVVVAVAEGKTPAGNLRPLRPSASFRVIDRAIDPKSYERYDPLADAIASLDAAGSARLYATLKPRIEEAYRDLGFPDASFDRTLERAIISLLDTPIPPEPIEVRPRGGLGYAYADPALEDLTAAQKHLLRMGPRNARVVQRKLREIALQLGIAPSRLPAPR